MTPSNSTLSEKIRVGHVQLINDHPVLTDRVALETINRKEIVNSIRAVDELFNPSDEFMQVAYDRIGSCATLDGVTIGSLLWKSESYYEESLRKIFAYDFKKARSIIPEIQLDNLGAVADLSIEGVNRSVVIIKPTHAIRTILSLAGMENAREERLQRLYPDEDIFRGEARYAENSEGILVAQWENARRIRRTINWALQLDGKPELDFVPLDLISKKGETADTPSSLFEGCYTPLWSFRDATEGFRETCIFSFHKSTTILPRSSEEAKKLVGALLLAPLEDETDLASTLF